MLRANLKVRSVEDFMRGLCDIFVFLSFFNLKAYIVDTHLTCRGNSNEYPQRMLLKIRRLLSEDYEICLAVSL